MAKVTCYKCNGVGRIKHYAFQDSGICYACMGTGKLDESRLPENFKTWKPSEEATDKAYKVVSALKQGKKVGFAGSTEGYKYRILGENIFMKITFKKNGNSWIEYDDVTLSFEGLAQDIHTYFQDTLTNI